jgi:hypothetical protein
MSIASPTRLVVFAVISSATVSPAAANRGNGANMLEKIAMSAIEEMIFDIAKWVKIQYLQCILVIPEIYAREIMVFFVIWERFLTCQNNLILHKRTQKYIRIGLIEFCEDIIDQEDHRKIECS